MLGPRLSSLINDWYKFYFRQCTVHFLVSLILLESSHLYWGVFSLLYILIPWILSLHLYATGFFLGYLSHQSFAKSGRWLLAIKLLFKGHFLINTVDKVVVEHLMWMGKVCSFRKFPLTVLIPSPGSIPSNWVLIKCYLASPSLLGSMKSLGRIHFYGWDHVFTFTPLWSSDSLQL